MRLFFKEGGGEGQPPKGVGQGPSDRDGRPWAIFALVLKTGANRLQNLAHLISFLCPSWHPVLALPACGSHYSKFQAEESKTTSSFSLPSLFSTGRNKTNHFEDFFT